MTTTLSDILAGADEAQMRAVARLAGGIPQEQARTAPPRETCKAVLAQEAARLAKKLERLSTEALRLARPLPHVESFHESRKQVRILSGSNQSSKTFHEELEIGRALAGCDPWGKYPKTNGRAIFVGYDSDHLANPLYLKLFEQGEFKIIRDEQTRKWRAVRPDPKNPRQLDPYDKAYEEQWKDAPPLIPPRMVANVAWEVASKKIPRYITLTNGWKTLWRSSNSRPPRGQQVHLVALDEDLRNTNGWVNEMIPRLVKHGGRLIWAATAQEGGPELDELMRKAEQGSQHIGFWRLLLEDNPFISGEQREFMLEGLTTEEDIAVRYYGETLFSQRRVYRDYSPNGMHGCEPFPIPMHKWARYVVLDPGRQHCGTIFLAVDPDERHVWVYDAIDLRHSNAERWAHEVRIRQHGMKFDAIICDQQMGKQTHIGRSQVNSVARQYWDALMAAGVQVRRMGPEPRLCGFFPSANDVGAREEALLAWMSPRDTASPFAGTPKLQVMRGMSPELDRQIRLAQADTTKHQDKRMPMQEDLLVCLEYAAAFNPNYHKPEPIVNRTGRELPKPMTVPEMLQAKRERMARKAPQGGKSFGRFMNIGG